VSCPVGTLFAALGAVPLPPVPERRAANAAALRGLVVPSLLEEDREAGELVSRRLDLPRAELLIGELREGAEDTAAFSGARLEGTCEVFL